MSGKFRYESFCHLSKGPTEQVWLVERLLILTLVAAVSGSHFTSLNTASVLADGRVSSPGV